MTSDLDLLRQYAGGNSQDAFAELVRRHVDLVYSAALRQVRSPQLAEEIAQSVFADLARQAGKISGTGVLPVGSLTPWLYAVTRRTAIDAIRKESRRQLREQIAMEMNNMNANSSTGVSPVWSDIEPLLDDAMAALDETDRSVVLLRYFENKSLREVGEALGASEDAAQKRVSRAVERLREFFSKRNVTIGASGLAILISANAVQSAPVGLAVTISAAALTGTAIHTSTAVAATKIIAMTTLQKIVIGATLAAAVGTGVFEAHQAGQLRDQVQTFQQQQAPLTEQIQQLQKERDSMTNRLASLTEEIEKTKSDSLELLKLRGEVGALRGQLNDMKTENGVTQNRSLNTQNQASAQDQKPLSPEAGLNTCLNNLRMIEAAMQQAALENHLTITNLITAEQLLPYLPGHKLPQCPSGGTYTFGSLAEIPSCSISSHVLPASIGSPATEQVLGVVLEALIQDNNGQFPGSALVEAREAYKQNHDGQIPNGAGTADFILYLKQPGPRLREAMEAYKQSHNGLIPTNALELSPYIPSSR